ncbi:MAG: FtsX-like permease family protein [Gemmatimonadetes bacterium]|nr:FtsX-like permease family protein [Gemmatimonadota bacterium]
MSVAGWTKRLLRLCLRTWPHPQRRRVGDSLIQAVEDARREEGHGFHWVLLECGSIVASGLRLRWSGWAGLRWSVAANVVPIGQWRAAWKQLRRAPAFAVGAVATLGVASGAGAAVLGLVQGAFLRPPDYERPSELAFIWNTDEETGERLRPSGPDVAAIRDGTGAFSSVAFINGVTDGSFARTTGPVGHVRIATATPGLFRTLGVAPALGRSLDTPVGGENALASESVVISHGLWQSALGADPDVVGATVLLNGSPVLVEGVLPAGFRLVVPPDAGLALPMDVWVPLVDPLETLRRADGRQTDRDSDNSGIAIARLASGVTFAQARSEAQAVWQREAAELPRRGRVGLALSVRPLHADATAHARGLFRALLVGVALLFFIACLNVSTLVLARGLQRRPEFTVRRALGAHSRDLLRQLSAETGVLVLLAAVVGYAVASGSARALVAWAPAELTGLAPWSWHPLALVGGAAAAGLLLLGFGTAPALRLGKAGDLDGRDLRRGAVGGRARRALVLCEVAVSVVLVLAAGLLFRTALELRGVRPGFDPEGAVSFSVSLRAPDRFRGPRDRARFVRGVTDAISALPGVSAAGVIVGLPLGGDRWSQPWGGRGTTPEEWGNTRADFRAVSSGYFEAMGVALRGGRVFTSDEDLREERRVAVVDVSLAEALVRGGQALGYNITFPLDGSVVEAEIVGIVEHVRYHDLEADGAPTIYVPYRQEASRDASFVVRSERDLDELAGQLRAVLQRMGPEVPVYGMAPLTATVDRAQAPTRFALTLMALFAAFGVLASAAGLYGILAFDVTRRSGEIGLRMALGASAGEVQKHTLIDGLRFASAGVVAGVFAAWLLAPGLEPLLFGVGSRDAATWTGSIVVVLVVVFLSSWLPSRRASRLSPSTALRGS